MLPNEKDLIEDIQLKSDGSNAELFYFPTDPITAKQCSKNYGGYIRNDIQLILEQTDETVAAELLLRLQDRQGDGISEQTMSDSVNGEATQQQQSHRSVQESIEYHS